MTEYQHLLPFEALPDLTADDIDDAEFRGKDAAWSGLIRALEIRRAVGPISFRALGDRINRTRGQVQRWLAAPGNMTLGSLSLLAEALDADLEISVEPRLPSRTGSNYIHPALAYRNLLHYQTSSLDGSSHPMATKVWLSERPESRSIVTGFSSLPDGQFQISAAAS